MAEYEGKKVKLNDPFRLPSGSKKKFGVYVKNPKTGKKKTVRYGAQGYSIAPGTSKGDSYCARSYGQIKKPQSS